MTTIGMHSILSDLTIMANNKLELEDLNKQLAAVLHVQELVAKALKNNPSPVVLSRCKETLASETKTLLLLKYRLYVGESVEEEWKSNSAESFELIRSVLKKVTLIEKEIDEKLEEASIDSISEGDVIHNSSDEGNYRSKPKSDFFSTVNGAGVIYVKDYKSLAVNLVSPYSERKIETQFLDYQEGKPFITWFDLTSDVSLKPDYVRVLSKMFSISIVKVYDEQFDVHKILIDVDNKLCSGKCLRCGIGFARPLFDPGKKFEASGRYRGNSNFYRNANVVYNYGCMPFDRGKKFEVSRRYSGYVKCSSKFLLDTFASCVFVVNGNYVYEFLLELGCGLELLLVNSNAIYAVKDGDNGYCKKLFVKMSQRGRTITSYGHGRRLFDRGKELVVLKGGNSVYEIMLEMGWMLPMVMGTEYVIVQRMLDQGMARDISFLTQMGLVREGMVTTITSSNQNLLDNTSLRFGWLLYMCARREKDLCDSLVLARTLFDRGKLFESISRGDDRKLYDDMLQQGFVLWQISILRVTRQSAYGSSYTLPNTEL